MNSYQRVNCGVGVALLLFGSVAIAQPEGSIPGPPPPKKETNKEKRDREREAEEAIVPRDDWDDVQREAFSRIQRMFVKLYGAEEVPAEALALVRNVFFEVINGTHEPTRKDSDAVADDLIEGLRKQHIPIGGASESVRDIANALSEDQLSLESLHLVLDEARVLFRPPVPREYASKSLTDIEELIRSSTRNEKKVKERAEAKKLAEEKKIAELKAKIEKAQKELEQKAKAASSARGGRGRGGSSSSSGTP